MDTTARVIGSADVQVFEKVTVLVAEYGVYALVVILLYVEWHAYREMKGAAHAAERKHFQRIHTWTVAVSLTFVFVASAAWWYSNFHFSPVVVGSLGNLFEQNHEPQRQGDDPFDKESLAIRGGGLLYLREQETTTGSDSWEIGWAVPKTRNHRVNLQFVHIRMKLVEQPLAEPGVTASGNAKLVKDKFGGSFTLDYSALKVPIDNVELRYLRHPRAPHDSLGKIQVLAEGKWTTIPWDDSADPGTVKGSASIAPRQPGPGLLAFLAVANAFAQQAAQRPLFDEAGRYSPKVGASLRSQLGGRDLAAQQSARNALVSSGRRAIRFIQESLPDSIGRSVNDRSALLGNLADALVEIEKSQKASFPDLKRQLALELYRNGSYQAAAVLYATVGASTMQPDDWYYLGYAYYSGKQYAKAITSVNSYLRYSHEAAEQSAAHTVMGLCHEGLRQADSAATHYSRALALSPGNNVAANNLAYVYAQQNKELPRALQLVNQALQSDAKDANYLDTKGWILYRQGRYQDALGLLEQAIQINPKDAEVLAHRDTVRKAMSASRQARRGR